RVPATVGNESRGARRGGDAAVGASRASGGNWMSREVTALAPWYGSNRMLAENVGAELRGLRWGGIPLAGGMTEIRYIDAPTLVVSDLHRHVINLARVVACHDLYRQLVGQLQSTLFHPDSLVRAQAICRSIEDQDHAKRVIDSGNVEWATQ